MTAIHRSWIWTTAFCVAALTGLASSSSRIAVGHGDGGSSGDKTKQVKVIPPIRNRAIKVLCTVRGSEMDSYWLAYYLKTCETQMNSEGKNDGNSFLFFPPKDAEAAKDIDFEFSYGYKEGSVVSLRMSGWGCGFIHEFKLSRAYGDDDKVADIYAELNRQAYKWIRAGWTQER